MKLLKKLKTTQIEKNTIRNQLDKANAEIRSLRAELNLADEIHYDEITTANWQNGLITVVAICLVIWIATQ